MSKKTIVQSAIILTVAGLITRVLGFWYRIYLTNAIGAEGIGLYQLIMPVYGLAWSIACSGFTTTISKRTAEERARGEYGNMGKVLKISLFLSCGISLLLNIILFFFAEAIAIYFFKETRIVLALKIMSFAFPFMAAGSCIRGYFFGLQESAVPAINQVLEQCVRMIVIFLLASTFIPMGLEYACAVCVIGIVAEEFFSFFYVLFAYKRFKKKHNYVKKPVIGFMQTLTSILIMAMPLTANRVTSSLLATLENILIPQRLQLFGASPKEAIIAFGQVTGMAMPLISFPSAFLISISISLVPAIAEASAMKNNKKIQYTVSKTMLFASIIGIGAASLFTVFSNELGMIIYKQDISRVLFLLGIMCPFIYVQMVLSGVLNGLGYQVFIFRNSILSSVINILFIYFLVPYRGVDGFVLGWFVSLIVINVLDIEKIKNTVEIKVDIANWIVKPLLSGLAAAFTIRLVAKKFFFSYLGDVMGLVCSIITLCVVYLFFIIITECLSLKDIKSIFKKGA